MAREEGIGDTLDIEDERAAGKHPLLWRVCCLELGCEHITLVSVRRHVHGTLVDTLLFFALNDEFGSAMNQWHDRELLLWNRFIYLTGVLVPGGTFKLEAEDESTVIGSLENWTNFGVPVEFLLYVSLDVKFVETLASFLGTYLLNGGKEGVWLVESVQEADCLVDGNWIILPNVEHLKALLHVVEPGVEATGRHP